MRFKTSVTLMVAIVLALVTAKVGVDLMKKYGRAAGAGTRVVIAKRDMEPGYVIQAADLALQEVPAAMATAKTFKDPKDLVGRTVIAVVATGYPMSEATVAPAGAGAGMQALIPPGMRAVTVDVSESSGVAGLLVPGSKVDVIATLRDGDQSVAATVVENVKVQFVQRGRVSSSSGRINATADPNSGPVKTVTLLVTPEQANRIELANSEGKPRLVLRGNADTSDGNTSLVNRNRLFGRPDEPAKAEPAPTQPVDVFEPPPVAKGRQVEIIRGGTTTVITYDEQTNQAKDGKDSGNGAVPAAGKVNKNAAGEEQRTLSGTSPDSASSTDAGRGN